MQPEEENEKARRRIRVNSLKKAQIIALYLRGYSEEEIAKELGVAPKTASLVLDGYRSLVAKHAASFLMEDFFAIRDRAWEWSIEVDKLRETLMNMSPEDPEYEEVQKKFSMAMAAYRDWWDRYMGAYYRFIGRSESPTSSVKIDARQQVLVVNAEDFYRRLQDIRRAVMAQNSPFQLPEGSESESKFVQDWIDTYAEVVAPEDKLEAVPLAEAISDDEEA